jgi:hypothetical protein
MPRRQVWIFKFGCWAAMVSAVVHLAGHLAGPLTPVNDTERQLLGLATTYRFVLTGGAHRSLMDLLDGFSLMFPLFLATIGAVGLAVEKRGRGDAALMSAVARMFAVSTVVLLGVSLLKFFIVPTLFIAVMAVCFLVASVESPKSEIP